MIVIEQLSLHQGDFELTGLSLQVPARRYGVLMGRTGSGKTSVLECIAGLRQPRSGRILLDGRDATHLKPAARNVGYLPQDGALFHSMTVRDHLAFGPRIRGWKQEQIDLRVAKLASRLGIEHLLRRRPHGLSGGETQRVALGRALSFRPGVLLLDEPLSSLDEETREQMMGLLKSLNERENVTVLHVTHSRIEAERLGDIVLRLEGGAIRVISPDDPAHSA